MSIGTSICKLLILEVHRPKSLNINHGLPTNWKLGEAKNPSVEFDHYFTNVSAGELIAALLKAGSEVEPVKLITPLERLHI